MSGIIDLTPSWRRATFSLLGLLGLAMAGCGGDGPPTPIGAMHQVKGKVKSEAGGSPTGLTIVFMQDLTNKPTARTAKGEVKADGSFELSTLVPGDGIAEGDYKIRFEVPPVIGKSKQPPPPIPARFLDEDASGLTSTINADTTDVGTIVLKNAPKAAARRERNDD